MKTLVLNLALLAASFGYAQGGVGPGPIPPGLVGPGYGVCGPVAHVLYDCPQGPGWMRVTAINVYGQKTFKQVYTGSRDNCRAQAEGLFAKRSQLAVPKIIAVCSATQNTLMRWMITELAQSTALPQEPMPTMEECLAAAKALNELP